MFLGQYRHSLDNKFRLTIPSRYRELLGGGAYILQGFDGNLMLYTAASFEIMAHNADQMSETSAETRLLKRLLFSTAVWVDLDSAGRILIPEFLRQAANIGNEVVLAGVNDHIELWSPERWALQMEKLLDSEANAQRFEALHISSQPQ